MKALAECRCWSLTPDAEDVIVVLLRRVTSEASGGGVLADHRSAPIRAYPPDLQLLMPAWEGGSRRELVDTLDRDKAPIVGSIKIRGREL
jgi:hypothetical protein